MDRPTDRVDPATRPRHLTTAAIMQPPTATGIRTPITTAPQSSLDLEDAGVTDAAGKYRLLGFNSASRKTSAGPLFFRS